MIKSGNGKRQATGLDPQQTQESGKKTLCIRVAAKTTIPEVDATATFNIIEFQVQSIEEKQ